MTSWCAKCEGDHDLPWHRHARESIVSVPWTIQNAGARPEMFTASFLFASLIWGSVGLGYFIYGKRQGSWIPMVGGVAMMALAYFISSALLMSLICIGFMVVTYVLLKRGY